MRKLLLIIILLAAVAGILYWYSQTEVVVDEPLPESATTEPAAKDPSTMTLEEKLADAAMRADIIPDEPVAAPALSQDVQEQVDEMVAKAREESMSKEEVMVMEKEAVVLMNPNQEELVIPDDNPAMMAMKGQQMASEGQAMIEDNEAEKGQLMLESGQEMMAEAMDKMMADGTLMTETEMEAQAVTRQGAFVGADSFHQVSGRAIVLPAAKTVRLENFKSINGPDLRVSVITKSGQRVDLGALKGNVGNQNYGYGANLNPNDIASIQIWCRAFNVTFGTAVLN